MLLGCGKVRWRSRRAAKKAALRARRKQHERASIWNAYRCADCAGAWHIGHRRPRGMAVAA